MTRPVHIVALGVRCAVGLTAESAAASIRAGISRVAEHPFMINAAADCLLCAREASLDPAIVGADRLTVLVERAVREIAAKLARTGSESLQLPLFLALPEPRPGFTSQQASDLVRKLIRKALPSVGNIAATGAGHAGALRALQHAVEVVSAGGVDLCLAGGVDSYLDAETIAWLESDLRVAREGVRSGFAPGEGAAVVAVASEVAQGRLGLPSLARVRGVGCAQEMRDPQSDAGLLGEGLAEAIRRATADLRVPDEVVTDLYGDINGERARTEDWGFALLRTAERFRNGTQYTTAAGQCGDVGAATGALGCALAVQAWRRDYARGRRALVWAGSWNGLRGAALLEQSAA